MIIVFGSKRTPDIARPLESIGLEVMTLPCFGSPIERIRGSLRLLHACMKNPTASVLIDTPHWVGLVTMVITYFINRQYIVSLRGNIFRERDSAIFKLMNRIIIEQAVGVVFISSYLEKVMAKDLPNVKTKCVIHAPHARMKMPGPGFSKSFDKTILTVTGFHFLQKIEPLLAAFRTVDRVLEKHVDARWVICGGGPFLKLAKRARLECKNRGRIFFEGHCLQISSYYEKAQLFLYLTGLDAFPLVVNEAFLFGLPVVANKESAMPEMIRDGVDGILVDRSKDEWENDLFSALSNLLDNPEKCLLMGETGKQRVQATCSAEEIGRSYHNFIERTGSSLKWCFKRQDTNAT